MAGEGQSDKVASDPEACLKRRCVTDFLHAREIAYIDIHQRLLNLYGDQRVDVSTVRQWLVCFSNLTTATRRTATFRMAMHSCHTTKWRAPQSAHPCESASAGDCDETQCFIAENVLYQSVIVLFASVSMDVNRIGFVFCISLLWHRRKTDQKSL